MASFEEEKEEQKSVLSAQAFDASSENFPEGGLRAWMVVGGVFLSQFCTFGYTNAYGVYNDFYTREYLVENKSSQISWIGSVQLFFVLSVGLFSGTAFDSGYFYHLMIGSFLLFEFCLFMISISQPDQFYQIFLTQGLGIGIAVGTAYVPALGVISHYFKKRRALAIGLATSGSAFGGAIHPMMLNALFHSSLGFHSGVKASAGLTGGLLIISLFLMKPRYPPTLKRSDVSSIWNNLFHFSRDLPYVIMIWGTIFTYTGLYYPIFFLQLKSIENGLNPRLAFYTIAMLNGASVAGRVIPNMMVYRFGAFNMMVPSVFITSILIFCTLAVNTVSGTIIFAVLYGFFSGAYASVLGPMVSSTADDDSEIGARLGICFTFTGFGGLVGTPIAGALLSSTFIWWRPTLFSGLSVFCGATCFLVARYLLARRKKMQCL